MSERSRFVRVEPRPVRLGRGRSVPLLAVVPVLAVALLVLAVEPPWRDQRPALDVVSMTVGGVPLEVEVARSRREQQRGLGYRDGLAAGTGMLFVSAAAAGRTFWMKGTRFCLDIVWIGDGRVLGATEAICPVPAGTPDEAIPRARSPEPVRYVLEVPAGWMARHGVGVGAPVTIASDGGSGATRARVRRVSARRRRRGRDEESGPRTSSGSLDRGLGRD